MIWNAKEGILSRGIKSREAYCIKVIDSGNTFLTEGVFHICEDFLFNFFWSRDLGFVGFFMANYPIFSSFV